MVALTWIMERLACMGYVAGIFAGICLLIFNRNANNRGQVIGFLVGFALVVPLIQSLLREEGILFLREGVYLVGGAYLIFKQLWDHKLKSEVTCTIFWAVVFLTLMVPFKMLFNLLSIWRA